MNDGDLEKNIPLYVGLAIVGVCVVALFILFRVIKRMKNCPAPPEAEATEAAPSASNQEAEASSVLSRISRMRDRSRLSSRRARHGSQIHRMPDEAITRWAAEAQMDERAPELIHEQSPETASTDQLCCSICLENVRPGQKKRTLRCEHQFHSPCIEKWLVKANRCPVCVQPVFDELIVPVDRDDAPSVPNFEHLADPSPFRLNILVSADRGENFHYQSLGPRTRSNSSFTFYYFAPH